MKHLHLLLLIPFTLIIFGCSPSEPEAEGASQQPVPATAQESDIFEGQVEEYIQKFSYQDTYNYSVRYTDSDPAKLNIWVLGNEPALVKANDPTNNRCVFRTLSPTYAPAFKDHRSLFQSVSLPKTKIPFGL